MGYLISMYGDVYLYAKRVFLPEFKQKNGLYIVTLYVYIEFL